MVMFICEAEVSAAVAAAKDALHLMAETGLRHVRNARHYAVRLRFLQELVVNKEVEFKYCPTDVQLADVFTKPLDSDKFVRFRDALMTP